MDSTKRYAVIIGETECAFFDAEDKAVSTTLTIASEQPADTDVRVADHIGTVWSSSEL